MREVELKSVVDDAASRRARVEKAGGTLSFEGRLVDIRYDTAGGDLLRRDHVLRVRTYTSDGKIEGHLDWKGETRYEDGYKVREEISTPVEDSAVLSTILSSLGFKVIREIEREIAQYSLLGTIVRFEHYPLMDDLVEIEGDPESIEKAISAIGLPREGFTSGRLTDFVIRFENRTGTRAALSAREKAGQYLFREGTA
ncbi:MAG: class IV adenylate cyclase [Thermoanaerobaculia bacterium]